MEQNHTRAWDWREKMIAEMEADYSVPSDWQHGPVKNHKRRVTDKCCLVIFVLFLLFLVSTMIWAL